MRKNFVLDTNILLHNPEAIFGFADNAVWSMGLLSRETHVQPWRIEDELKAMGVNYIQGGLWRGFAVRDGNLITGQQNFSGLETARLIVQALGE